MTTQDSKYNTLKERSLDSLFDFLRFCVYVKRVNKVNKNAQTESPQVHQAPKEASLQGKMVQLVHSIPKAFSGFNASYAHPKCIYDRIMVQGELLTEKMNAETILIAIQAASRRLHNTRTPDRVRVEALCTLNEIASADLSHLSTDDCARVNHALDTYHIQAQNQEEVLDDILSIANELLESKSPSENEQGIQILLEITKIQSIPMQDRIQLLESSSLATQEDPHQDELLNILIDIAEHPETKLEILIEIGQSQEAPVQYRIDAGKALLCNDDSEIQDVGIQILEDILNTPEAAIEHRHDAVHHLMHTSQENAKAIAVEATINMASDEDTPASLKFSMANLLCFERDNNHAQKTAENAYRELAQNRETPPLTRIRSASQLAYYNTTEAIETLIGVAESQEVETILRVEAINQLSYISKIEMQDRAEAILIEIIQDQDTHIGIISEAAHLLLNSPNEDTQNIAWSAIKGLLGSDNPYESLKMECANDLAFSPSAENRELGVQTLKEASESSAISEDIRFQAASLLCRMYHNNEAQEAGAQALNDIVHDTSVSAGIRIMAGIELINEEASFKEAAFQEILSILSESEELDSSITMAISVCMGAGSGEVQKACVDIVIEKAAKNPSYTKDHNSLNEAKISILMSIEAESPLYPIIEAL